MRKWLAMRRRSTSSSTPSTNIGWRIALAWAKAWDPANDGARRSGAASDADYRFAVLQAQLHRRMLAAAVEALDLLKFVRYVRPPERLVPRRTATTRASARVMRATLGTGLARRPFAPGLTTEGCGKSLR